MSLPRTARLIGGRAWYSLSGYNPINSVLKTSWRKDFAAHWLDLLGRTDFLIHFQRDVATSRLTAEAWNIANGNRYFEATRPLSAGGVANDGDEIAIGDLKISLAYMRLYDSVIATCKLWRHFILSNTQGRHFVAVGASRILFSHVEARLLLARCNCHQNACFLTPQSISCS
jgi:hypothetical protein